jgi:formylglycine-generating enzyme required for sulfatase activity
LLGLLGVLALLLLVMTVTVWVSGRGAGQPAVATPTATPTTSLQVVAQTIATTAVPSRTPASETVTPVPTMTPEGRTPTRGPTAEPPTPTPKPASKPAPNWVHIPAGNFIMGSSESDLQQTLAECQQTEGQRTGVVCQRNWFQEPQQTVALGDFEIMRYEVTNAQYNLCVAAGVCQKAGRAISDTNIRYDPGYFAGDFPVMAVSWNDADGFCRWVGGRLPTEAEWEKAARGTDGRRYPWGNSYDPSRANLASTYPTRVGSYLGGVSPYGITDMAGNVFEWTASKIAGKYVVRGGAWTKDYFRGRVADRGTQLAATFENYDVGFRCAR